MKKTKILALAALMLAAVLLFCSCSLFENLGKKTDSMQLHEILDGSSFVDTSVVYHSAQRIDELRGAQYTDNNSYFVVFKKRVLDESAYQYYTETFVYSRQSNSIVFSERETDNTSYRVSLHSLNGVGLFTVVTTTYEMKYGEIDYDTPTSKTALYSANGFVAEADYSASVSASYEYILFDGKYYSADADGNLTYALDRPDFGKIPEKSIFASNDEYYYVSSSSAIEVYNKNLEFISSYSVPSYVEDQNVVLLENGNLFIQYLYGVDSFSDKYDIIDTSNYNNTKKYNMVSLLVDPLTGEEKEIDFEYIIYSDITNNAEVGLNDQISNIVALVPIVDKRIDSSIANIQCATISGEGTITLIEGINGQVSIPSDMLNANLWIISTVMDQDFLMDASGNVLAEITNYEKYNNSYILSGGKVFDFSLNEVYNYEKNSMELIRVYDNSILFQNTSNNELVLFANNRTTTLCDADSDCELYANGNGSFVIKDSTDSYNTQYIVYNTLGNTLISIDGNAREFNLEYISGQNSDLIEVRYWNDSEYEYEYQYYWIH